MAQPLDQAALDRLFLDAYTHNKWQAKDVADCLLERLVDVMKMGPTSAGCSLARILLIKSQAAKKRLEPYLSDGNRTKTMAAPATAIIGYDLAIYEQLPRLFPRADAKSWFVGREALIQATAFRNASLQGAYLIVTARALGLDAGPMSGFDNDGVDKEFFPDTTVKSNSLCNLAYGDPAVVFLRSPRLAFAETARIL